MNTRYTLNTHTPNIKENRVKVTENIKIIDNKIAYHRNGVCGEPFTVGLLNMTVDCVNRRMLIIQFDKDPLFTAVFDFNLLKNEIIEFTENSWRGDHFMEHFKNIVEAYNNEELGRLSK